MKNGTLDLKTAELRPHDRADLLTKYTPITYDPDATCPAWERFLLDIFAGDVNLIGYIQKAVGYSLTGLTTEQCLFLLYGMGANGKSTFLNILIALLSEYGEQADFSSFLHKERDNIRNDLAKFRGARFVSAVEAEEGKRLAEVLVKQVTGGDPLTARFLFAEFFTFQPIFKLWLAANHKPEIRGTDYAIWRRIRLIPFTVTFTEEKQDKALLDKLKAELPGILRWAVFGCQAWQDEGLQPPDAVQEATASYRSEMDVLGGFFAECCLLRSDLQTPSSDLFAAYLAWAKTNGVKESDIMSQTALAPRLKERGLTNERSKITGKKVWHGIGLVQETQE